MYRCPDEIFERLVQTQKHEIESNGIQATRLCTHRNSAEQINIAKMQETKGEMKVFYAKDSHPEYTEQMEKSLQAHRKLVLKIGAQASRDIFYFCFFFFLSVARPLLAICQYFLRI